MDHHAGSTGGEQLPSKTGRVWSWVATTQERDERREHAHETVGLDVAAIRYINIDYSRWDLAREHVGPRPIVDAREWQEPTWRYHDCDCVDHGVELQTSDRRVFSITWDPPGVHEGLGLREQPSLGTALPVDADVAVWDVTNHSSWPSLTGRRVDDMTLHYENWGGPGEGFWCPRISLQIGTCRVEFLMSEGETDHPMSPSADNIAVVFTTSNEPIASRPAAWWRRRRRIGSRASTTIPSKPRPDSGSAASERCADRGMTGCPASTPASRGACPQVRGSGPGEALPHRRGVSERQCARRSDRSRHRSHYAVDTQSLGS